jgi:Tol biopolymer transport system component
MTLAPGARLGPYEILSPLGAGGMGEVWRARDTKLGREVALKVLPSSVAQDAERLQRFEREAQVLASLNHPHIAAIFGVEDSTVIKALVLELVEGETLQERIARGPIALDEAIAIARQVAEALEAAHERGVVHRDLKPANIKLQPDDTVKVLDFGLAKALDPLSSPSSSPSASPTLMNSPTLTAAGTAMGVILGTAAYMSPEQAKGRPVDKRADVWSFGVVLWEMLSGRRLFEHESVPETLGAIFQQEIDFAALPTTTPARLRDLVRRCLERDPKLRLRDIGEARITLAGGPDTAVATGAQAGLQYGATWRRVLPWALVALLAALWAAGFARRAGVVPAAPRLSRLPLDLGEQSILLRFGAGVVLSADGRRLAWVTGSSSDSQIMVRDLSAVEPRTLAGTAGAHDPVFSPDGEEIAYFASTALYRVPFGGGAPVRLADVGQPRGVTWTDDGYLVYNRDVADGLWQVRASGGSPERLTELSKAPSERSHRWPSAVRGRRQVLFLAQELGQKYEEATIELLDLESRRRTVVHRGGTYPRMTRDHVLLYARDRGLWAAPVDLATAQLKQAPRRVVDEIGYSEWSGAAQFDVADDGTLVVSTGESYEAVEVSWFDPASGRIETAVPEPGFYYTPALSPDGRSLAIQLYSVGRSDVWIFDLVSGSRRRLTFGGRDENPVWSPDGTSIAFSRLDEGKSRQVARMRADGVGEPTEVAGGANARLPTSWSSNGALLMTELAVATHGDIWVAWPDQPTRPPEPLVATPADESDAVFSPDGRWVLYESDESGTTEIYARSFPGAGGRWQLSEEGGIEPHWALDGRAVYFLSRNELVRREVGGQAGALVPGRSTIYKIQRPLFRNDSPGFAVGADGRILLFPLAASSATRPRTVLMLGWGSELARLLGRTG